MSTFKFFEDFEKFDNVFCVIVHSLGLVGNISMLIVYNQANLCALSVSVYFRFMAVICASHNLMYILQFFFDEQMFAFENSQVGCKLINYLLFVLAPMAVWLEVLACLDRFLTIVFPLRLRFIGRASVQRVAIAGIVIFNSSVYSIVLINSKRVTWLVGPQIEKTFCSIQSLQIVNFIDFLAGSAIPFVLMVVLSILTILGVVKARKRVEALTNRAARVKRDLKFGVTICVLNLVFFLFNFPYRLIFAIDINPFSSKYDRMVFVLFTQVLGELYQIYYSMLFYVQLVVNRTVRRELWNLIKRSAAALGPISLRSFSNS